MQLKMSALSMEQVLADAQLLVGRLKEHDSSADNLLSTTQTMYRRIDSMKQYEAGLNQLNEMGRHRPRSNLILALVKENNQIRQLQQENKDLRACLEEHQSAIELIMSKYREQVAKLLLSKNIRPPGDSPTQLASERANVDKICEMAAVMQRAARMDEQNALALRERLTQLETENRTLRQLLKISVKQSQEVTHMDCQVQVDIRSEVSKAPAKQPPPIYIDTGNNQQPSAPTSPTDGWGGEGKEEHEGQAGSEHHLEHDDGNHFANNDKMNNSVIENQMQELFAGPLPKQAKGNESKAQVSMETNVSNENNSDVKLVNSTEDSSISDESAPCSEITSVSKDTINDVTSDHSEKSDSSSSSDDTSSDDVSRTLCEDLDTTVVDNNTGNAQNSAAETTILETTLVNSDSPAVGDNEGTQEESDNSESEGSPNKMATNSKSPSGATGTDKRTPVKTGSGKKSTTKGSKMVTIKRNKGKVILQDMNANTGGSNLSGSPGKKDDQNVPPKET